VIVNNFYIYGTITFVEHGFQRSQL
jgi:hypothetical protein